VEHAYAYSADGVLDVAAFDRALAERAAANAVPLVTSGNAELAAAAVNLESRAALASGKSVQQLLDEARSQGAAQARAQAMAAAALPAAQQQQLQQQQQQHTFRQRGLEEGRRRRRQRRRRTQRETLPPAG
jgi:hypothetical protein